jgi:hypothetical protein
VIDFKFLFKNLPGRTVEKHEIHPVCGTHLSRSFPDTVNHCTAQRVSTQSGRFDHRMTTNDSEVRLLGYTLHTTSNANLHCDRQNKTYELNATDYGAIPKLTLPSSSQFVKAVPPYEPVITCRLGSRRGSQSTGTEKDSM